MSKFKVGDRVRCIEGSYAPERYGFAGEEYEVLETTAEGIVVVPGERPAMFSRFELVAPPLTLQAGKLYKTRDGRKVGPMESWSNGAFREKIGDGCFWDGDGTGHCGAAGLDLIAECADEPAAVGGEFKVGDRVEVSYGHGWDGFGTVEKIYYFGDDVSIEMDDGRIGGFHVRHLTPAPSPAIGDWVKDKDGRTGIVFFDDGATFQNLYVGYTKNGERRFCSAPDLTVVPPGTEQVDTETGAANDNYEVGDIVEIIDRFPFEMRVKRGDLATVLSDDGREVTLKVHTDSGAVEQFVSTSRAIAIRPYRRTA